MHSGTYRTRQIAVFLFFLLSLSILFLRLFYIQVIRHSFYDKIASEQHTVSIEIPPVRGAIFDRNMRILAVNLNTDSVMANPREIADKEQSSRQLSSVLNLSEDFVFGRISREKSFVWIKRKITPQESEAVKKLKINGVKLIKESKRVYPNKGLACHSLGTVNIDNVGMEGIELNYDKYLHGENGLLVSTRDAKRMLLESYQYEFIPPKNGFGIVLTIDEVIQHIAERELLKAYEKYNAKGASIVVMSPKNGDILAIASLPGYDLNNFSTRPADSVRNKTVTDFFEPGSIFKIVTAAAILEENAVKLDDKIFCENGEWKISRRVLHDHRPHGTLTFKEVIEKSSNIGTIKAALVLGSSKMYKYMKLFGFYDKTRIDLPGEVVGMNRPISKWSRVSMYAIPMGQEVTATAIQLACAITVIADNGYLLKPRIVKEILDPEGRLIKEFPLVVKGRVISSQTVLKMRSILRGVVETGTGKKAGIGEYTTAGKTGTAQKVDSNGQYSHDKFVASFIGFAPVEKPVIAVAVCIDEPRPVYYGGEVAAPVFRNVVNETLKYINAKGIN